MNARMMVGLSMRSGVLPTPMQLFNLLVESGQSPDEAGDAAWSYSAALAHEKARPVDHPADAIDVLLRGFTLGP